MEIVYIVLILFAIFVVVRLVARHEAAIAYQKRVRDQERRVLEEKTERWKREDEQEKRYHREILVAEALRLEQASGIATSDLHSIRDAHPSHIDPFTLVQRGWNPSIVEELNPAEIVIACGEGRELPLYSTDRVQQAEVDALDRSQEYIYRLCDRANQEEQRREAELLAKEEARVLRERMEKQVVVDITAIRNKTTNEPPASS
jgi:hypothetical protein